MKYGICVPLRFERVDGETAEEFLASEEIVLKSGDEKALAEAARTAEEIDGSAFHKVVDKCCLVDVDKTSFADFLKILYGKIKRKKGMKVCQRFEKK